MEPISELQGIAMKKGGNCLSQKYSNNKGKLLWQCEMGHQWFATPFSIKVRKSWCPVCAGNQPLGMKAMHQLAEEHEGKCLSTTYENCKTKMHWLCLNSHRFESTPDNIMQGRWCKICCKNNLNYASI